MTSDDSRAFLSRQALLLVAALLAACGDGGSSIDVPPLEITTATTGSDLDPDGYIATVDDGTPVSIGINDTVVVGDAGSGSHVVRPDTWGSGPGDFWAVGTDENDAQAGVIEHYDGTKWVEAPRFADVQLDAVWGTGPNDVYAAGQQWSLFTLPSTADREPLDIWGTSPQNLYVAGVLHGPADPKNANDQGLILHYNGSAWDETIHQAKGIHLKAVWGSGADNVYMVGDPGVIVHWDGTGWGDGPQLITTALHEIWGTSPDNVYAVAARGHILRFDGAQWSSMDSPTGHDLFGIWGSGPGDAWVVGNAGVILHGTS